MPYRRLRMESGRSATAISSRLRQRYASSRSSVRGPLMRVTQPRCWRSRFGEAHRIGARRPGFRRYSMGVTTRQPPLQLDDSSAARKVTRSAHLPLFRS